jgi:small subunit ribosomal protein S15
MRKLKNKAKLFSPKFCLFRLSLGKNIKLISRKETLMAVTTAQKAQVLKKFGRGDLDTGSPEVQVALITARIEDLAAHFATHKKDNHGRRGLVTLVNQRRKLLDYLHRVDSKRYLDLIQELKLRK